MQHLSTPGRAIVFLVGYAVAMTVLVWLLSDVACLGDPKFGCSGFEVYWPLLSLLYLPFAVFAAIRTAADPRWPRFQAWWLSFILAVVTVGFVLDLGRPWLLVEYLALGLFLEWRIRRGTGNEPDVSVPRAAPGDA